MIIPPSGGALIAAVLILLSGLVLVAVGLLVWNEATFWQLPLGIVLAGFGLVALRGATGRKQAKPSGKRPIRRR